MIPAFDRHGSMPPGIHWATLSEIVTRFGFCPRRRELLAGLKRAVKALKRAGCVTLYLDGSFVTGKEEPGDYDVCWDISGVNVEKLDPVFLEFSNGRAAQKRAYLGEFFPAQMPEGASGKLFLDFFQMTKETGRTKGIVGLDLREARS